MIKTTAKIFIVLIAVAVFLKIYRELPPSAPPQPTSRAPEKQPERAGDTQKKEGVNLPAPSDSKPDSKPVKRTLPVSSAKTSNTKKVAASVSPSPTPKTPPPTTEIKTSALIPAASANLSNDEIYSRYSPAVIQIFCATSQEFFSASGVIVNDRGLVLTNAHVAEIVKKVGEKNCEARHRNPARSFAKIGVILSLDTALKIPDTSVPQHDVAFLKITDTVEPFSVAEMSAGNAAEGETLLTLGYPSEFLEGNSAVENSNLVFSLLTVDGFADLDDNHATVEGYVFHGGLILQRGSSGTALFNREGKVVGLMFATTKKETTAEREGVALIIPYIDTILRQETGLGLMEFIASH